uniref:Tryptophan-rich sensory protein n=1 Tax=Dictyoglomus thermophilum TaxID=14 RepID=A0A7C3MLH0_DICTH
MDIPKLVVSIAIPLIVGGISGFFSRNAKEIFDKLVKPSFAPPPWLFGPIWTILYFLMGVSLYRVLKVGQNVRLALIFFSIQLFLNFIWSPIFFVYEKRLLALFVILLLLVFAIITTIEFYKIDRWAGLLFIPYLLWLSFATILNYSLYYLNR